MPVATQVNVQTAPSRSGSFGLLAAYTKTVIDKNAPEQANEYLLADKKCWTGKALHFVLKDMNGQRVISANAVEHTANLAINFRQEQVNISDGYATYGTKFLNSSQNLNHSQMDT